MQKRYVDYYSRLDLYLTFILYTVASFLFAFNEYYLRESIGNFINWIVLIILVVLLYRRNQKEFHKNFINFHNLENLHKKDIDYIYHDVYSRVKDDSIFFKNKKYLKDFTNLEIHKTSFFNNSFTMM